MKKNFVADTKSLVRFGWHHLRSFPSPVLDIFRSHVDRQGRFQNAPTKNVRNNCFQRNVTRKGRLFTWLRAVCGSQITRAI